MGHHFHGWVVPHLAQMRAQNNLKHGTKSIKFEGSYVDPLYKGELD